MPEEDEYKIHRLLDGYLHNHTEIQSIKQDIQEYQKQFKNRLDDLKKQQKQTEDDILNYLEQHQLPGIRKGDFIILADEKPIPVKKKSQKERIQSILQTYQIDSKSQLAQDLNNIFQRSSSDQSNRMKYIKCKQYS